MFIHQQIIQPWAIGIGPQEMTLLAIGLLVLFGAKKLPELARGMGEGMREFKKAVKDINADDEAAPAAPAAPKTASAETPEDVESRIVH